MLTGACLRRGRKPLETSASVTREIAGYQQALTTFSGSSQGSGAFHY